MLPHMCVHYMYTSCSHDYTVVKVEGTCRVHTQYNYNELGIRQGHFVKYMMYVFQ
jgi:hypothetical protein